MPPVQKISCHLNQTTARRFGVAHMQLFTDDYPEDHPNNNADPEFAPLFFPFAADAEVKPIQGGIQPTSGELSNVKEGDIKLNLRLDDQAIHESPSGKGELSFHPKLNEEKRLPAGQRIPSQSHGPARENISTLERQMHSLHLGSAFQRAEVPLFAGLIATVISLPRRTSKHREQKGETAWFENSKAVKGRLEYPPAAVICRGLNQGDFFLHWISFPDCCQVWTYTNGHWRSVRWGYKSKEGRRLIITENERVPSLVQESTYAKTYSKKFPGPIIA
ncbi:hypothetical protein CVT26_008795 [Gymnopilus dilepis]|uniref:Uncharacterized protein n=1 Tax=Gymnopilus dilepis TaxID=231916 RepID=A0A409WUJ7_9AGAR|nr:hypothetical protein CVT26_008795 [Gymnopilus dilepis]